tara:strand:+ start:217 stop:1047 length:831 start_codon:yes stop_codon:yes gene_type:complete
MALTIEALYEAYMDEDKDFAEDVWGFFAPHAPELTVGQFKEDYGVYLPTYDPTKAHLAFQDKALSFIDAADTYTISKAATDRVYSEEMQKVSGGLEEEMAKGREIAGGIGLRTGSLESALEDTMTTAKNKATNLGDRLDIQQEDTLNAYNQKVSDATLDYEKDIHETKEEFYNRVLAAISRLTDIGAFRQNPAIGTGGADSNTHTMANNIEECVRLLGPEPVSGTDEFNTEYEKMYSDEPLSSYWGRVADCQGVPFIPPDTPIEDWEFDFSGALGM